MHKIVKKEQLNSEITLLEFEARDLAKSARAGQFVVLRVDEYGERFPLTLYDWNAEKGTISVVCQAVGVSTKKLTALNEGQFVLDIVGPLGNVAETKDIGKIVCIGGGVGTAEAFSIARQMHNDSNQVKVIIGARNKNLVICEKQIREFCDEVHVITDDGSSGRKGLVTDALVELLDIEKPDLVLAVGPVVMMKAVSQITKSHNIKTKVSLNSIMIDGTGMCGSCRVLYDGKIKFACVDGPVFDGHLIDFDDVVNRSRRYFMHEKEASDHYGNCKIGLDK